MDPKAIQMNWKGKHLGGSTYFLKTAVKKMNTKVGGGTLVIEDNPRRGIKQKNKVVYAENQKQLTFNTA